MAFWIPMAIGAGASAAGSLIQKAGTQEKRPKADVSRAMDRYFRAQPGSGFTDPQAKTSDIRSPYTNAIEAQIAGSMGKQYQALTPLAERSVGQNLLSSGRFDREQRQQAANLMSLARGQRGRANIGVMRAAERGASAIPSQMAAERRAAEIEEIDASRRAFAEQMAAIRAQEAEELDAIAQQEKMANWAALLDEETKQKLYDMGLMDEMTPAELELLLERNRLQAS